jgi:hypothetical protein
MPGGLGKHEAKATRVMGWGELGAGVVSGTGWGIKAVRGTSCGAGAACGVGWGVGATYGMSWSVGTARGMATFSEVLTKKRGRVEQLGKPQDRMRRGSPSHREVCQMRQKGRLTC